MPVSHRSSFYLKSRWSKRCVLSAWSDLRQDLWVQIPDGFNPFFVLRDFLWKAKCKERSASTAAQVKKMNRRQNKFAKLLTIHISGYTLYSLEKNTRNSTTYAQNLSIPTTILILHGRRQVSLPAKQRFFGPHARNVIALLHSKFWSNVALFIQRG